MISVVINTYNEEKNLPRALASVEGLADEIVVCDMHSVDKTVAIAKKAGAHVVTHPSTGYVEPARNFAISKARGPWILVLDADEEVPPHLAKRIKQLVSEGSDYDFYRIPRKNIIFGKWITYSRWWPDSNIRLFKKGAVLWSEVIHAVPETHGKGTDLEAIEENALIHYHYTSVEQYITRMNMYTTEHAKLRVKEGYVFSWRDLIKKPMNEFLSRYFFGKGYKDGIHGLALSGLQAFSEFVLYLKIWQAKEFKEETPNFRTVVHVMRESESELHYWQADSLLHEGGGMIQRIKRKFKLP